MRTLYIGSDNHVFRVESDYSEDVLIPVIFDAASEALTTSAPAASVATFYTTLDATAQGVAATLADGRLHGQLKKVQAINVDSATTLTIASPVSASLDVVTFADVGDFALLIWNSEESYWRILETGNDADGVTAPAVA